MRCVRLIVTGRVQGVGYRAFFAREAARLALAGWVRNRIDGSVEALIHGDDAAVTAALDAARRGPSAGRVDHVAIFEAGAPEEAGFLIVATA